MDLISGAISKIKNVAGSLYGGLSNSLNDNQRLGQQASNFFQPNQIFDKSTGIPSFLANAGAAQQTMLGTTQSALSQINILPYAARDYLGNQATSNLNSAMNTRQQTGTMGSFDQGAMSGLNTSLNVAAPALKTGLTVAGGAKMLATPLIKNVASLGIGFALGGVMSKLGGGDVTQGAISGVLSAPLYTGAGLLGEELLAPLLGKINPVKLDTIKPYLNILSNPMVKEETKAAIRGLLVKNGVRNIAASSLEAGTGNAIVGASEKANNLSDRVKNALEQFTTGVAFGGLTKAAGFGIEGAKFGLDQYGRQSAQVTQAGKTNLFSQPYHPDDMNEMVTFLDYVRGIWKPSDKPVYESSMRDMAAKYGINPERPNAQLAKDFQRILEKNWDTKNSAPKGWANLSDQTGGAGIPKKMPEPSVIGGKPSPIVGDKPIPNKQGYNPEKSTDKGKAVETSIIKDNSDGSLTKFTISPDSNGKIMVMKEVDTSGNGDSFNFVDTKPLDKLETGWKTTDKETILKGIATDGKLQNGEFISQPSIKTETPPIVGEGGVNPLIQEARKYKSAEEFVKAQGEPIYHGTNNDFKVFDKAKIGSQTDEGLFGKGFYFGNTKEFARIAPAGTSAKNIMEVYPSADAKLFDISKIKSKTEMADLLNMSEDALVKDSNGIIRPIRGQVEQFTSHVKELGYDGVLVNRRGTKAVETVIFETSKINTKSQLTDIYNQSKVAAPLKGKEGKIATTTVKKLQEEFDASQASSSNQPGTVALSDQLPPTTPQKELPKSNIISQSNAPGSLPPTRESVAENLPKRLDSFIQDTLGYSTADPKSVGRQGLWDRTVGSATQKYTNVLRSGQEKISRTVESGLGSENGLVRNAATTLQNFFRGIGMSPERATASMELRGGMSVGNERAFNVMESLYKTLGNNKKSLERINAVLDPSLSKKKLDFKSLSSTEKLVYRLIRQGLDIVHDTSYANGHISPELYAQNKGKYVPRLYQVTELPAEASKFVTQGKKIDNNLYKAKGDINAWKMDNSLNDPVYALGKRLAQVETNAAIKKYTDFLSSNPNLVSDVERAGFTKLSDSPAYGALSGKFVLNSAAEDLKGFFFSNQTAQNLYDVFRAYDRMPIRQLQKKLLTVFNPTTNVGNIVSDQVFGFVTGVDPLTLNKNLLEFNSKPELFKQYNDYLTKKGITGSDITRTDFVDRLGKIDSLAKGDKGNVLTRVSDKVQSFYGGTDDVYKVSAFKALLDRGIPVEEATRKIADGFQNYANVGKFYDVWAKTPIVGSTFIKFQGDLIRIIKNGAVNNPLGLITFLGTLQGISLLSSKLHGESPEDYKSRTERFGAPMIPGLNIPLAWQTPFGEINVARYISPFFANNETTNLGKMLPFVPNIDTKKDVASNIAMNVNDPLLSTPVQLAVNRDFRGKPISDPNENKFQPSTLTPEEKLKNQATFAGRAYLPPPVNSVIDVKSAVQGKPNMYGATQTPGQAVARLAGIKVSQMEPQQLQEIRDKNTYYDMKNNDFVQGQINAVVKQQLNGEITQQQAQARIDNLNQQAKQVSGLDSSGIVETADGFHAKVGKSVKTYDTREEAQAAINRESYKNSGSIIESTDPVTGMVKKVDVGAVAALPDTTNYERAVKQQKTYALVDNILQSNLSAQQQAQALTRLGITPQQAQYYNVATQSQAVKEAWIQDQLANGKITNRNDFLKFLGSNMQTVNGKSIVDSSTISKLYNDGVLTYTEKQVLNQIQYNPSTKSYGVKIRRGRKPKKIKMPKLKLPKGAAIKFKTKKIKIKKVRL